MTDKEKIKAALRFCSDKPDNCIGCPVFSPDDVSDCTSNVMNVAANIIDRLEADNAALREKLEAVEAERDDLKRCGNCAHWCGKYQKCEHPEQIVSEADDYCKPPTSTCELWERAF